jgi:lysophospholipase L1-like esterase
MRSSLSLVRACLFIFAAVLPWAGRAAPPPFGENVQFRGSLTNSRIRFEQQKKGTVAFMGGSITEMNGYRPMVCERLQKRFPQTAFKFVEAGISSTCSTTGAFRLASDVFAQGPVDLLFVEFAVNDDQDAAHTRVECIRGMEGIIRHARQLNPNIDIVMTFFVNEGMLKTLQEGKVPLTIEAHETVAKHEAVSTINLAKEAAEEITAGKLTWKQYGGVHPAPYGNAIAASMIDELFDRAWVKPVAAGATLAAHPVPEPPLDPLSYTKGRFIDPKKAHLILGWTLGIPDWKVLPGGKRPRFTTIPILSATEAGAELTLDFEGTTVGAFVVAGPDAGEVLVRIDGGRSQLIDVYHNYSSGLHYPRSVILGTNLKNGPHTLKLHMSELSKHAGHAMRIIQFEAN